MAEKHFTQMTTKKLNALLATANEEDKVAILDVLKSRGQAPAEENHGQNVQEYHSDEPLTEEEQKMLDAAEANGGINPMYNGAGGEKKQKMSDEERHALAKSLKDNVNHRCQVVPFNTAEWVDGTVAAVIEEKRSGKVLYAIKTDDGRRIVKVCDSKLLKILDEIVEPEKRVRERNTSGEKIEWTPEALAEEISKYIDNVGRVVSFEKYRTVNESGEETTEMTTGRIVAIVPDKRVCKLLYRITIPTPTEEDPAAVKTVHKMVTAQLEFAEFDEEGAALNAKYRERREAAATRTPVTPQDRFIKCEENLKKAEEKLQKAQEELELKRQQLEEAKKELDAYLNEQIAEGDEPAEAACEEANEESLA